MRYDEKCCYGTTRVARASRLGRAVGKGRLARVAWLLVAFACTTARLGAQAPATATHDTTAAALPDSLAERLERAEAAIQLLQQQLAAMDQSSVKARSRSALEFNGRVLTNVYSNSGRVNNVDVPQFVLPPQGGLTVPEHTLGILVRQTTLGLAVSGATLWGAALSGDVNIDLWGPEQSSAGGRELFPLPRLRTMRAFMRWTHGELMAGSDVPIIAPLNPVSLAAIGLPEFAGSGNLWLWLPQVRGTVEMGTPLHLALVGGALSPWSGNDAANDVDGTDVAERARRPYVEARLRSRWGDEDHGGEIGIGVHQGWLATSLDTLTDSRAVAADAKIPLGWLELRAEAFTGKVTRGLGGGGIGQNFGTGGKPMRDQGGWAQLNLSPSALWLTGVGCGMDDPNDEDAPVRLQNTVCEAHLIAHPGGGFVTSIEYRRLETKYASSTQKDDHINFAVGYEF